jgi:hypothetical protein
MTRPLLTLAHDVPSFLQVEMVVYGGAPFSNPCTFGYPGNTLAASRWSFRTKITWTPADHGSYVYSYDGWQQEDMLVPRVGGDAVALPNGDVVLINGAQVHKEAGRCWKRS